MRLLSTNYLIIWLLLSSLKFAEYEKVTLNGIAFAYRQKLLLAENFVNMECLYRCRNYLKIQKPNGEYF